MHATFSLLFAEIGETYAPAQSMSTLDAPGATGNVTVDERLDGVRPLRGDARRGCETGAVRVSACCASRDRSPAPGASNDKQGPDPQVQIKVLKGQVSLVTPGAVVFRLRGQPPESA